MGLWGSEVKEGLGKGGGWKDSKKDPGTTPGLSPDMAMYIPKGHIKCMEYLGP